MVFPTDTSPQTLLRRDLSSVHSHSSTCTPLGELSPLHLPPPTHEVECLVVFCQLGNKAMGERTVASPPRHVVFFGDTG